MKTFFRSLGIVVALSIAGMILAESSPNVGVWVGLTFLLVPLFAVIKPLPQLHLGNRAFSMSIAFFVGLMTTATSYGIMSGAQRLAQLRQTDPTAYLAELKNRDQEKWLSELELLDPKRHAIEAGKIAEAEADRKAEAEAAAAEKRAEEEAQRQAEQEAELASYIEQLDREIASIPGVTVSNYTGDVSSINIGLVLIGTWGLLYERGEELELTDEARQKRRQFRQLLVKKQAKMLPALRDAYGPAMRQQLWEADASARTIGAGYRTVEFVSAAFARNANIKQIHLEVREILVMLRFNRAQYKWFKQASEYTYFTLEVPKDTDIVKWESGGRYRILN